jgi:hypothetical protein
MSIIMAELYGTPNPYQESLLVQVKDRSRRYKLYSRSWATSHYVVGSISASLAFIVGVNGKAGGLFGDFWALILGALAAVAAGLVTTLEANTRASRYQLAWHVLDAAAADFEAQYPDANVQYKQDLRKNLARAIAHSDAFLIGQTGTQAQVPAPPPQPPPPPPQS